MNWREPKKILKVGEGSWYILQLWASNGIVGFGNEAWSEDLIMSPTQATEAYFFQIYTSPTQATEAYLRPLLSFSSVIATFEIFH